MGSALYWINTLSWIFKVLANWNNSPRVDMSSHSDTIAWFPANQSLLFLLIAACLAEKQQIPIVYSLVLHYQARTHDLPHSRRARSNHYITNEPTIYHTRGEHALTITLPMNPRPTALNASTL